MRTFDNSKLIVQELSLDEALRNSDGEIISITKTYELTNTHRQACGVV